MVDYGGAFKKPFQDITKLVVGIVLMIIPIVNFLSMGYFIETARKTLNNDDTMPEWNNFGNLFIQGLVSIVIGIIYMIPTMILIMVAAAPLIGVMVSAATAGGDPTTALGGALAGAGVLLILAALIFIITVFLLPMAMVFYAKHGFGGAFKIGSIFKACLTGSYIITWIIVMIVTLILSGVLMIIPFIGSAIASFYTGIVGYSLFAKILAEQGK